ncbi:MAG: DUF1579 family protein [Acidobacteria bacterium]|nr:DUF1579 family protein [Acidobacteriota bacterium]
MNNVRRTSVVGMFLLGLLYTVLAASQQPPPQAPGPQGRVAKEVQREQQESQPQAEHQILVKRAGDYVTHTKYYWTPRNPPQESAGTARFSTMLDGRFLVEEDHGSFIDQPSTGYRIYGYNNGAKQYEAVWTYTRSTAILTMTGQSKDGGKTIDYAAQFDEAQHKIKKLFVHFQQVNDDEFVIELSGEMPDDPRVVTTYTRRK